jgi:hypothetical protein
VDLDLLDEIEAWLGSRDAVARAREVRPVDQKDVFIRPRAERGYRRRGSTCGGRRRHSRRGPDEVEHARPPGRDSFDVFRPETGREPWIARIELRVLSLNVNGLCDASDSEQRHPFDGGTGSDLNAFFVVRSESGAGYVEDIDAGRENGKTQLPSRIRRDRGRAANQRRGTNPNDRPHDDASVLVLHGPDQGARESLRQGQS